MSRIDGSGEFVNRLKEIEDITKLLSTGDVLLLGEAGIGKTALVNKIVDNLKLQESPKKTFIFITATPASHSGWLPERLTLKVYQQMESDQKTLSRARNWLSKHSPSVLRTVQALMDMYKAATGQPSALMSSFASFESLPSQVGLPTDYKVVILTLLDQYFKQTCKEVYVIIEDSHALSISDKVFLTDLLANHSGHIHFIVSRRSHEDEGHLYSSPEVVYLSKANRIVRILGLNKDAVELFLKAKKLKYTPTGLQEITALVKGNPYFLRLLAILAVEHSSSLNGNFLKTFTQQEFSEIWNYLHSQFYLSLCEFEPVLRASSVLPSNIHAEIIGQMLNDTDFGRINDKLLELEQRGVLCRGENSGYYFFHPLFELYIYKNLPLNEKISMQNIAASYYKELAEVSPSPLNMIATLYHAEQAGNKNIEFWVHSVFASIYQTVGLLNESKEHVDKSLMIARELGDEEKEFESLTSLFGLMPYLNIKNLDKELVRLKFLAINGKLKTEENQIAALHAEANYYVGLGDENKAINPLQRAIRLAKKIGDVKGAFYLTQYKTTLIINSFLPANPNQFKKTKRLLNECLLGFEEMGEEKGIMYVLGELGNMECSVNPKRALKYFKKCLEISKRRNDLLSEATALHGMGIAYFELKNYIQSEKCLNLCLSVTKRSNDTKGLIATYTELASAMIKNGKLVPASKMIQEAEIICKNSGYKKSGQIELVKGELLKVEGKPKEAKRAFLNASKLFSRYENKESAAYAKQRALELDLNPLDAWILNVTNGLYETKIGSDGLTDNERKLEPFLGKTVRIVVNQGKWLGTHDSGMRIVYIGTLHKQKHSGRLEKMDRLMGHGKYDWWIEGRPEGDIEEKFGNWLIAPIFVEWIGEVK